MRYLKLGTQTYALLRQVEEMKKKAGINNLWKHEENKKFQEHIKKVANDILDVNRKTNKRMLVLCTSFKQIYEFESYISSKIDKNDNFL